jgi:hypothetical protein
MALGKYIIERYWNISGISVALKYITWQKSKIGKQQ